VVKTDRATVVAVTQRNLERYAEAAGAPGRRGSSVFTRTSSAAEAKAAPAVVRGEKVKLIGLTQNSQVDPAV
jgi:hypothetical protein